VLYVYSLEQAKEALKEHRWCQCWDGERNKGAVTVTEAEAFYGEGA
jgi:hypothetical protein